MQEKAIIVCTLYRIVYVYIQDIYINFSYFCATVRKFRVGKLF